MNMVYEDFPTRNSRLFVATSEVATKSYSRLYLSSKDKFYHWRAGYYHQLSRCCLLFTGPPASAKTLFLLGILEFKKGVYFDGSSTTNRILDVLEEKRPKIICIDELDKMPKQFQDKLLNFMESGHI
jgi:hypothetical protein